MDVITIGESMVLLSPESTGPLRYVHRFNKFVGGAESNVAVGLSRLGHKVGWVSKLGNDEFGLFIRNVIRGEGVDTSHVQFIDDFNTGVYFKERSIGKDPNVYYYRNNSAASTLNPEDISQSYFSQAKYLHLTGITPALSETSKDTVKAAIKSAKNNPDQYTVFDPNIRLKLWSEAEARKELLSIAKDCDIIMPGLEEGQLLTGEDSPEKISAYFLQLGASLVIVKLGAKGAYFATKEENGYVPGMKVDTVVDTVGAGDGFAAGVISGLLRGWSNFDAVNLGNKIGAYALGAEGDFEGYPYWEEIDPNQVRQKITR